MDTADFSGFWTGQLSGTNQGGFTLEITQEGTDVAGSAKINEPALGVYEYRVTGKADKNTLKLSMAPSRNDGGLQLGNVTVEVELDADDKMSGRWQSSIGTAGIARADRFKKGGQ